MQMSNVDMPGRQGIIHSEINSILYNTVEENLL
jgi:hypothetical protein